MRHHFPSLARIALIGAIAIALGAVAGFAQSNTDTTKQGPAPQASLVADPGVLVVGVQTGSPAEEAGIVRGDVILEAKGAALSTIAEFAQTVTSMKPGDTLAVKVRHGDVQKSLNVVLAGQGGRTWMGVLLYPAGGREGRMFGGPRGVFVAEVASDSPAAKAGIAARDLITKVEGASVADPQQVVDAVAKHKPGESLTLTVRHGVAGKEGDVTVTLGENPKEAGKAYMGVSMREMPFGPEDRQGGAGMRGIQPGQVPAL